MFMETVIKLMSDKNGLVCQTSEDAEILTNSLRLKGYSIRKETWDFYKENTCYTINSDGQVKFGSVNTYLANGYAVRSWCAISRFVKEATQA